MIFLERKKESELFQEDVSSVKRYIEQSSLKTEEKKEALSAIRMLETEMENKSESIVLKKALLSFLKEKVHIKKPLERMEQYIIKMGKEGG